MFCTQTLQREQNAKYWEKFLNEAWLFTFMHIRTFWKPKFFVSASVLLLLRNSNTFFWDFTKFCFLCIAGFVGGGLQSIRIDAAWTLLDRTVRYNLCSCRKVGEWQHFFCSTSKIFKGFNPSVVKLLEVRDRCNWSNFVDRLFMVTSQSGNDGTQPTLGFDPCPIVQMLIVPPA